ncbi:MAG: succinyl-diaminopimelate desuccinylase [Corynebacterium sp.]|nr:succinyl-diaminopimelate desuccinylase [Corynebacterium sp.]
MIETNLNLLANPVELTKALVDIPSPSHHEEEIANAVEAALRKLASDAAQYQPERSIEVQRFGNTICARTSRGFNSRVVLAGHIDTVPIADNVPHTMQSGPEGDVMWGCGTVDMKSGMACYLHAFAALATSDDLCHDLTLIAYEGEEVASEFNGLGHLQSDNPEWLAGDLALLGEPSGAMIEAGCQGTIRLRVTAYGQRAHSARGWLGSNAAHTLAPVIQKVADYQPDDVEIDGLLYREGLNIVHLESGVATNTIPDVAWMFVNYRYAPHRTSAEALTHMLDVLGLQPEQEAPFGEVPAEFGVRYEIDDIASAAQPGLAQPAAAALIDAVGGNVRAKFGWTDVARFSELGTPAVNFGPGDPGFAHKKDEQCPISDITQVAEQLCAYLTTPQS